MCSKGFRSKNKKKYNIPLKQVINRPMDKLGQQNSKALPGHRKWIEEKR